MRIQPSKQNRHPSIRSAAALALLAGLALSACDDKSTEPPAVDANKWISITKPTGGESFKVGDSLRVGWTVKDNPAGTIEAVDVVLSPDSGKTWVNLPWGPNQTNGSIKASSAYWNNFAWKVTNKLYLPTKDDSIVLAGRKCLVRVEEYATSDTTKQSTTRTAVSITP